MLGLGCSSVAFVLLPNTIVRGFAVMPPHCCSWVRCQCWADCGSVVCAWLSEGGIHMELN